MTQENPPQDGIIEPPKPPGSQFDIGAERWAGISKLIEECGEATQVCGKLIAAGGEEKHWDGSNLRERLQEELADLYAAISFVIGENKLDKEKIGFRVGQKIQRFARWHAQERVKRGGPAPVHKISPKSEPQETQPGLTPEG